jgi:hypothetical protein
MRVSLLILADRESSTNGTDKAIIKAAVKATYRQCGNKKASPSVISIEKATTRPTKHNSSREKTTVCSLQATIRSTQSADTQPGAADTPTKTEAAGLTGIAKAIQSLETEERRR